MRHPETVTRGALAGWTEVPLSTEGRRAFPAILAETRALGVQKLVSSDLSRCRELAEYLGEQLGLVPHLSAAWREIHLGQFEGLSWAEVEVQYPDDAQAWLSQYAQVGPPGGESLTAFAARLQSGLNLLWDEGVRTLVITHAGVIRTLSCLLQNATLSANLDLAVPYGALFRVRPQDGRLLRWAPLGATTDAP